MDLSFLDTLCDAQGRPLSVIAGWFAAWYRDIGAIGFTDMNAASVYFKIGNGLDNKLLAPWIRSSGDFEKLVKAVAARIGCSVKVIRKDGGTRDLYRFV